MKKSGSVERGLVVVVDAFVVSFVVVVVVVVVVVLGFFTGWTKMISFDYFVHIHNFLTNGTRKSLLVRF